ncbi:MAG: protoporphyrinogen oxidase [Deltaproteobacteria bacterium]|nr:protoporphyrinogen oxidase [Deltaproteobacteria bacterium]
MFSFREGLGFLPREMARRIGETGVRTGTPVDAIERAENGLTVRAGGEAIAARCVVCAVPPPVAAKLLGPLNAGMGDILAGIPMAPVAVVHLGGDATQNVPPGFGALIPRHYGIRTLGTVFVSQLFPGRAPEGHFVNTAFIGGTLDPEAMKLSDDELLAVARADQAKILGIRDFDFADILRYTHAIPQLVPDHPEKIDDLRARAAKIHGLVLAGNYLTGVGIDHAVGSGYTAADGAFNLTAAGN